MEQLNFKASTVILCDGSFPSHQIPLSYLKNAEVIICCDGAADKLIDFGMEPTYIVGDLDSVSIATKKRFSDRLFHNKDQETNDQTKAVEFALQKGFDKVVILGATGKREDHTIGNISLLLDYAIKIEVISISNSGVFIPLLSSQRIEAILGQQISIFSIGEPSEITSENLKYPLKNTKLNSWWIGTLNECLGDWFALNFEKGKIIVFQKFMS